MTTERKSRGMSFSGPMVLALLNTKPDVWPAEPIDPSKPFKWQTRRLISRQAPFEVGQLLYVREAIRRDVDLTWEGEGHDLCTHYATDGRFVWSGKTSQRLVWRWNNKGLPARYMPREAARVWLVLKAVRRERVQAIDYDEIMAEGCPHSPGGYADNIVEAIHRKCRWFKDVWDSLQKKAGTRWGDNPWVWVYEIMRTEQKG